MTNTLSGGAPKLPPLDNTESDAPEESPGAVSSRWRLTLVVVGLLIVGAVLAWLGGRLWSEDGGSAVDSSPGTLASRVASAPSSTTNPSTTTSSPVTTEAAVAAPAAVTVDQVVSGLAGIDTATIRFEIGTDELTLDAERTLSAVADVLIGGPWIPVEVVVATSTEATDGTNHGLSVDQADAILGQLIERGVDPSRLAATGVGDQSIAQADDLAIRVETEDPALATALVGLDAPPVRLTDDGSLSAVSVAALDRVADIVLGFPATDVVIVAHAFGGGTSEEDHDRSHEIADQAVARLVAAGVQPDTVAAVGRGGAPVQATAGTYVLFEVGAPAALTLQLRQLDNDAIDFETDRATLTAEAVSTLDQLATILRDDPEAVIDISAHAYSRSTTSANHALSHEQGDAVVAHLVASGVEPTQLRLAGHGDPPHFAQPGRETYFTLAIAR